MIREGGRVIREESRRVGEEGWKIGEDCRRMTKGWAGSPTWLAQRERDRDGGRSREGINDHGRG